MPRATNNPASRKRRKKVLKRAKGFFSGRRKLIRTAKETTMRAMAFATRDRRDSKSVIRKLWITRISAGAVENGMTYSRFIEGLKAAQCTLDRKVLADLAATDAAAFTELVTMAQNALKTKAPKTAKA